MNTIPKLTAHTRYHIKVKYFDKQYKDTTPICVPASEIIEPWFLQTNLILHDDNIVYYFSIDKESALEQIQSACGKTEITVKDLAKVLEWDDIYRKFITFNKARDSHDCKKVSMIDFLDIQNSLSKIQNKQIQDRYKELVSRAKHPERTTYMLASIHQTKPLRDNKDLQLLIELPTELPTIECNVHLKQKTNWCNSYNIRLELECANIRNYIQNCILNALNSMETETSYSKRQLAQEIQRQMNIHNLESADDD